MQTTLASTKIDTLSQLVSKSNQTLAKRYPGDGERLQPVHTVYEGAHLFHADRIPEYSKIALKTFQTQIKKSADLTPLFGKLPLKVYERVLRKLRDEAIEDYRIDFEDGFGVRPDKEEDETAVFCGSEVGKAYLMDKLPPYIGIRIKTFTEDLKRRSLRTIDLFLTACLAKTSGKLPHGFVITLPKITHVDQVTLLTDFLTEFEKAAKLPPSSIPIEFMVEAPQTIFTLDGRVALPEMLLAARGRCRGAHLGTYDFTAALGITAHAQMMDHIACDFGKNVMQVSLAGTGVWISDGSTNILPIIEKNSRNALKAFQDAWKLSFKHIQHSLNGGFYQGWDLHPNQVPVRYIALYAFFLESFPRASLRLKNYLAQVSEASKVGAVFDDIATGQALMTFLTRALYSGAITFEEALATGLTREELEMRSFKKIWEKRTKG